MAKAAPPNPERAGSSTTPSGGANGHDLIAVAEWLPGKPPTPYERAVFDANEYETRFWRCRTCGQERNRRDEFTEPCVVAERSDTRMDGGYSIDDARTRRALSEAMSVHFVKRGPVYRVDSESGNSYLVDVEAETCTCPDHETRSVYCKHLRRVDLEIRAGTVPATDGTFRR